MTELRVGSVIPGYCGGVFILETAGRDLRVEYIASDWLVVRDDCGNPHYYEGTVDQLLRYVNIQIHDDDAKSEADVTICPDDGKLCLSDCLNCN